MFQNAKPMDVDGGSWNSSEPNEAQKNIFQLSEEMLRLIVSYIPDKRNLTLTCRRFYDIVCESEFKTLRFVNTEILDDSEKFKTHLSTKRRFNFFVVEYPVVFDEQQLSKLEELLTHLGKHIRRVELFYIYWEMFDLLKLMPNIEQLSAFHLHNEDTKFRVGSKLNLQKLREFTFPYYPKLIHQIFNVLPTGVLRKVKILPTDLNTLLPVETNLFANQRNVKELLFGCRSNGDVDLKQLKLKTLNLCGHNLQACIQGQDEISNFCTCNFVAGDLKFICTELKSLEAFNLICDKITYPEFQYVWNLKRLHTLKLGWENRHENVNDCLKLLRCFNLRELSIFCKTKIESSTMKELGRNLPRLKTLSLATISSPNLFNTILEHFPMLENLRCDNLQFNVDNFIFEEEIEHANLKQLIILGRSDAMLLSLAIKCSRLEILTLSDYPDESSMQRLLKLWPNLRLLCFTGNTSSYSPVVLSKSFFKILSDHGRNLRSIFLMGCEFGADMSKEMLKNIFNARYSYVNFWNDSVLIN